MCLLCSRRYSWHSMGKSGQSSRQPFGSDELASTRLHNTALANQQPNRSDGPESQKKEPDAGKSGPEHRGVEDAIVGDDVAIDRILAVYLRRSAGPLGGELIFHPGQDGPIGVRGCDRIA